MASGEQRPADNTQSDLELPDGGKQCLGVRYHRLFSFLVILAAPGDTAHLEIEVFPSQVHDRPAAATCCFEKHQAQLGANPRTAAVLCTCTLASALRRLRLLGVPLLHCLHCSPRLLE